MIEGWCEGLFVGREEGRIDGCVPVAAIVKYKMKTILMTICNI